MEKKDDNNNNVVGVENKNSTATTLTERPRYAVKLETLDSNSDVSANSSDVDQEEDEEEEEDAAQYDEFTDVSARSDENFSAAKPAVPVANSTTPTQHYQKNQTKSSKSLRRATPATAAAEPEPDLYSRAKIDYASSLALNTMDIFDPNKAVCAECRRLDYLSPCQVHCELQVCEVCVQKHLQIELNEFIRIKSFLESSVNEIRRNLSE